MCVIQNSTSICFCPIYYNQKHSIEFNSFTMKYLPIYGGYILFYILLTEYANTELKKDEVHMLWIALQTSLQATKAKITMLLTT